MDPRTFERIEENMLAHKTRILRVLCQLIKETDTNVSYSPELRMQKIREQSHATAEMLSKIDSTLATLKKSVKECVVAFDNEVNYIT